MKKYFSLLLVVVMIFSLAVPTYAAKDKKGTVAKEETIKVKLCNYIGPNGKWVKEKYIEFDVEPQIIDGRTMVPIRAVVEELGWSVFWQGDTKVETGTETPVINGFSSVILTKEFRTNSKSYNYETYNQYNRFLNLLYNLEVGNRTEATKNFKKSVDFVKWNDGKKVGSAGNKVLASVSELYQNKPYKKSIFYCYIPISNNAKISVKTCPAPPQISIRNDNIGAIHGMYHFSDVEPMIINGRTLLPLRAVAEMLGLDVSWDGDKRLVTISA